MGGSHHCADLVQLQEGVVLACVQDLLFRFGLKKKLKYVVFNIPLLQRDGFKLALMSGKYLCHV